MSAPAPPPEPKPGLAAQIADFVNNMDARAWRAVAISIGMVVVVAAMLVVAVALVALANMILAALATPATISRAYTDDLIAKFAADQNVIRFGSAALVDAAERKLAGESVGAAAIGEAVAGLFDAPGGDRIDVVALACTHFPLLAGELAAAAPRACLWLDSGAAIARRVAQVLATAPGQTRIGRAAFTDIDAAQQVYRAFRQRGFGEAHSVGVAPDFAVGN